MQVKKLSKHFGLLICQLLVALVGSRQFKRIRQHGFALLHAGDHVGAAKPVGLSQVRDRPLRGMIGMGMVEADNVFAALAAFALNANQFFGIDVVAIMWRIVASVAAARDRRDGFRAILLEPAKKHPAALVRIGFFSMLAQSKVSGLGKF